MFLKISKNLQKNTCARVSFLINLQAEAYNFIKKETLEQVFYCEFCEISQNTFSCRTPPVAACDKTFKRRTGHVQFTSCVQVVCEKVQLIVSLRLYYLIILSFVLSQLTNFKSLHEHDTNYYLGPWQISMMKLVATIVKSVYFQTHGVYLWEYLGIARHLELVKRSVYPFL